jgi:glutamate synthase domain-containing protein 3
MLANKHSNTIPAESQFTLFKDKHFEVDAKDLHYRHLNTILRKLDHKSPNKVKILNVTGQRYIGTGLKNINEIEIHGTPGNDLGAFLGGPSLSVYGNAQDGCGNTMNSGEIIVHGSVGDILGYSMRGGKVLVKGNVGYRAGIHMKEYRNKCPTIIVGGTIGDFLGEYMAGGVLVVLGLNLQEGEYHNARYVGTGMHGGVIYLNSEVKHMGKEVVKKELDNDDKCLLERLIREFSQTFNRNYKDIVNREFYKLLPLTQRPYGQLYCY